MWTSSFHKPIAWLSLLSAVALTSTAAADEISLGTFVDRAHDLAGEVVAISDRVLEVRGFGFDGNAPDAFFWADSNSIPSGGGFILSDAAPSNNCGQEKLAFADGTDTYRVEFPDGYSLHDIKGGSISVWCRQFGANFGEVTVPDTLEGLKATEEGPALQCSENAVASGYEGVVLGSFAERAHDLEGEIVALSDRVLEIRGFGFDGDAPDAFFWADTSSVPSADGFILWDGAPSTNCGRVKLGYADGSVTYRMEFPEGYSLHNITGGSISVWCRQFGANFGELVIPDTLEGLDIPAAEDGPPLHCTEGADGDAYATGLVLGEFIDRAHDLAGEIVAISDRVLEVRGFEFDGNAPDAFFWADSNSTPSADGFILSDAAPSNNCGQEKLAFADGTDTYRVEFPDGYSLHDIKGGSISVWCRQFGANFGEVVIPMDLEGLPVTEDGPALQCSEAGVYEDAMQTPEGYNCEPLHEDFQVRWKVDGDEIAVELVGFIGETDYMGFGVSGADDRTEMVGADVIVGDLFQGEFRATDYYMSARAQCSNGGGVCPDMGDFENSVTDVSGARENGVTVIKYRRELLAADTDLMSGATVDRDISVVPGENTFIAWALGPVDTDAGFPFFHSIAYPRDDVTLEFGRQVQDNCEPLVEDEEEDEEEVAAFERPVLRGETDLYTAIGPSGGDRGYLGISGRVGWGIAWYVNDLLLPVIEMERGTTYTFHVNGGHVTTDSANYHPMYLTTSISGGYAQTGEEDRMAESIFGGLSVDTDTGAFESTAVGPICKYTSGADTAQAMIDGTYEEFYASLDTSCSDDASITGAAATLEFTPDENTPDLLYYQCVTHRNLGWEIRVVDSGETFEEADEEDDLTAVGKTNAENKDGGEDGEAKGDEESPAASTPNMRGTDASSTSGAKTMFSFGFTLLLGVVGLWMI